MLTFAAFDPWPSSLPFMIIGVVLGAIMLGLALTTFNEKGRTAIANQDEPTPAPFAPQRGGTAVGDTPEHSDVPSDAGAASPNRH